MNKLTEIFERIKYDVISVGAKLRQENDGEIPAKTREGFLKMIAKCLDQLTPAEKIEKIILDKFLTIENDTFEQFMEADENSFKVELSNLPQEVLNNLKEIKENQFHVYADIKYQDADWKIGAHFYKSKNNKNWEILYFSKLEK